MWNNIPAVSCEFSLSRRAASGRSDNLDVASGRILVACLDEAHCFDCRNRVKSWLYGANSC